jgi:glycerol-3-phosphate acyltransferase PlsY
VLVLDIAKGFAATFLPLIYSSLSSDPDTLLWVRTICGIAAALGHIYPVFAGFRGGKAVATLLGVMLGLMMLPAAASLLLFIIVFLSFRMVSLGSVLAGLSLPFTVYFLSEHPIQLVSISVLVSALIVYTHRKNIGRIIRGEESKVELWKSRRAS